MAKQPKKKSKDDAAKDAAQQAKDARPKPKYNANPNPDRVFDKAAVEQALAALRTFDWGGDYDVIKPIDDAAAATHGDAAARQGLETQLVAVLQSGAPRPAKDFACRMLGVIGSVEAVPALAELLTDNELSHMARFSLERIGGPEPTKAVRAALPKVSGAAKAGVIESLGAQRDGGSVDALAALAGDADKTVAFAAINALGKIGTAEAAKALGDIMKNAPDGLKVISADASLACAERLAASGKKMEAILLYKGLGGEDQPKRVRLAATRGLLAAAAKKE